MKFEITLECEQKNLLKILTDYENLPKFLPRQLSNVKIINQNDDHTTIEATIQFKTLIKKPIIQTIKILENIDGLSFSILDGHAKNTTSTIVIVQQNNSIQVIIDIDLKLSLAAKILTPIIKREYKLVLQSVMMKMANEVTRVD
tara:strand:- start:283 stop:714 length:432 start_codon:yes stop_codon:yes gene_type:complete